MYNLFLTVGAAEPTKDTFTIQDITVQIKVSGVATNGEWSLSEWTIPAYSNGVPMHHHEHTQKLCYVIDGVLAWTLDQQMFTVSEGDHVVIQPGVQHCFFNPAAAPATLLVWSLLSETGHAIVNSVEFPKDVPMLLEHVDYYSQPGT